MAEIINPIIPKLSIIDEAIAGSAGVILSATDREIIKKRVGEISTDKDFTSLIKDLLGKSRIIDKVESEEKQRVEQEDLKTRLKLERRLIKNAPYSNPPEKPIVYTETKKQSAEITRDPSRKLENKSENLEAIKIEWLKEIVLLKELHLKRVFSSTKKEFEVLSLRIKKHTLRARKLGSRISHKGVNLVESRLETLALDTANYKLKLLKSMQELGFDKDREKDILWLRGIISHLESQAKDIVLT